VRPAGCLLCLIATLLAFGARSGKNQAKYDPEDAIRPIRALLAISEEPVKPGSSCDKGRLIAKKPGSQQIGDMLAILLAYHNLGINVVQGSCEKEGDSSCSVSLKHKRSTEAEEEYAVFKFKILKGKAQADSLECELSP